MPDSADHLQQVHALFLRHSGVLHAFIAGMIGDLAGADDVLQESFLVVTQKAGDFTLGSDFLAWARAVARRKAHEHLHARQRGGRRLSDEALAALEACPPEQADWSRQVRVVDQCIQDLPERARQIATLRFHDGQSSEAIAKQLSWTVTALRSAITKLRVVLRDCVLRRMEES